MRRPPWSTVTVRLPTTIPLKDTTPPAAACTGDPAAAAISMPQCPLKRPVGVKPRTMSPARGDESPTHDVGANTAAPSTKAARGITMLHRRHRSDNLGHRKLGVKAHADDPTSSCAASSISTVARRTAPV